MADTSIRPFRVNVPDEAIEDLRRRLAATRWPENETAEDFSQGVQLASSKRSRGIGRPSTTGASARRG
jgi:O-succinylbenzoate synthase